MSQPESWARASPYLHTQCPRCAGPCSRPFCASNPKGLVRGSLAPPSVDAPSSLSGGTVTSARPRGHRQPHMPRGLGGQPPACPARHLQLTYSPVVSPHPTHTQRPIRLHTHTPLPHILYIPPTPTPLMSTHTSCTHTPHRSTHRRSPQAHIPSTGPHLCPTSPVGKVPWSPEWAPQGHGGAKAHGQGAP